MTRANQPAPDDAAMNPHQDTEKRRDWSLGLGPRALLSPFLTVPAGLGVLGAVSSLIGLGVSPWGLMAVAAFLLGGGLAGQHLHRHHCRYKTHVETTEAQGAAEVARLHGFAASMEDILAEALPIWSRQIETSSRHIETSMTDLTKRFVEMDRRLRQLVDVSQAGRSRGDDKSKAELREAGEAISTELMEVLVTLQFQDRVGQILAKVRTDLERLAIEAAAQRARRLAGQAVSPLEAAAFLAGISNQYATSEQHWNHINKVASEVSTAAETEATFF